MPYVITIAALKGGVGKSTLTTSLGDCLHAAGKSVVLIDADPQGSLTRWADVAASEGRDVPPVMGLGGPRLRKDLPKLAEQYEIAIIDTPARLGADSRAAMVASDLVVIPASPGPNDLWSLEATLGVLEEARGLCGDLAARLVLNRATRYTMNAQITTALEQTNVPLCDAKLHAREDYGHATAAGMGVVSYKPDGDAAREVRRLLKELLSVATTEVAHG